jgi:hypothetical protein
MSSGNRGVDPDQVLVRVASDPEIAGSLERKTGKRILSAFPAVFGKAASSARAVRRALSQASEARRPAFFEIDIANTGGRAAASGIGRPADTIQLDEIIIV